MKPAQESRALLALSSSMATEFLEASAETEEHRLGARRVREVGTAGG